MDRWDFPPCPQLGITQCQDCACNHFMGPKTHIFSVSFLYDPKSKLPLRVKGRLWASSLIGFSFHRVEIVLQLVHIQYHYIC